jgi:hypothetical protein
MELGKLTDKQLQAAKLVAGKKQTIQQIADQVGVSTRTIDYWKTDDTFQAEVKRLQNLWRLTVRTAGVADPEIRLHDLTDLRNRLFGVIYARAKDPEMQEVPGGRTGLLTKRNKMRGVGLGESIPEPEYAVDTGLVTALIAVQRAAVDELEGGDKQNDVAGDIVRQIVDRMNTARRRSAEAKRDVIAIQPAIESPSAS